MIEMFRRRQTTVWAIRWTGDNADAVRDFTGNQFETIDPQDRDDDSDMTAQVYDRLHNVWVPLADGDWVLRGIRGEHWPVRADVFAETYEQVSA